MTEPLYEIANEILELQSIETGGDESLEEAIKNSLDGLNMDFNDKTDNIVRLINQIALDTITIDTEIKRLQTRKVTFKNHQEGIKKYLLEEMMKLNKKTIKTALFTVTSMTGRMKVIIDKENEIPSEFINIKVVESPDKKALLSALKDGEIKGCHAEKSDNTLRVK